ncbi:MAG: hypothetical protein IT428_26345 [Planctomycetaceae bacterium]|nr:hypothetical protein [Planctomycetaceae bacterium]
MANTAWLGGPKIQQQLARLRIMCSVPAKHRMAWRSIYGPHLICEGCAPPASERVVAERIDLDEELKHPRSVTAKKSRKRPAAVPQPGKEVA